MGLDMYLRQSEYFSGYNFLRNSADPERRGQVSRFDRLAECVKAKPAAEAPSIHVETTVAYWRKANAIHGWFVRELADGVDQCQQIEVTRANLQSLVAQCKAVKATMDRAKEAGKGLVIPDEENNPLPPTEGFFFGDIDDAQWYYDDLTETITKLEKILEDTAPAPGDEPWDVPTFIYQASW